MAPETRSVETHMQFSRCRAKVKRSPRDTRDKGPQAPGAEISRGLSPPPTSLPLGFPTARGLAVGPRMSPSLPLPIRVTPGDPWCAEGSSRASCPGGWSTVPSLVTPASTPTCANTDSSLSGNKDCQRKIVGRAGRLPAMLDMEYSLCLPLCLPSWLLPMAPSASHPIIQQSFIECFPYASH